MCFYIWKTLKEELFHTYIIWNVHSDSLHRFHTKRQGCLYSWWVDRQTDWLQTCTCSVGFFFLISGYCFSKLPQATEQHLRSPRPAAWLLIASLHLCHMNSWWDGSSVCILESTSTQVKMLGLPRSSQKPLVWVRICLAAVPWHSGRHVHVSPLKLGEVRVCVFVWATPWCTWMFRQGRRMKRRLHISGIQKVKHLLFVCNTDLLFDYLGSSLPPPFFFLS